MRQDGLDAIHRVDHVRAWLLEDLQQDAGVAVLPGHHLIVLRPVDRNANVADPHRGAVHIGDDDVVPGFRLHELVVVVDGEVVQRAVEGTLGGIDGGVGDDPGDVLELDAHRGDLGRVHLHPHRRLLLTADRHLGHPRDARHLLRKDVLREIINRGHRQHRRVDRVHQDRRVRRIDLLVVGWGGQVLGQLAGGGRDGRLDVLSRGVDVAVKVKLHRDLCRAQDAGRGHLRDTGNRGELGFQWRRDRGRHGFRARPGQLSGDLDSREVHLRQAVPPAAAERQTMPTSSTPAISSDVAIGRLMKGVETLMRVGGPRLRR